MTPERWKQIERMYHRALALMPDLRLALLEKECAGDPELHLEVESLLAAHKGVEQTEDFLKQTAPEAAARVMAGEQAAFLSGREIGRYRILSLLGRGGMGEVYLARDQRLGRKLALKFLPREFTQDQERVRRFEQEARAASALNHPNIVTIYEIDQIDGYLFIAAEFIDGQTLRQRLASPPMELTEALDVAVQIASALAEAHAAGIVHRDIKPENIMLWRDNHVKVLDFGLAKLSEAVLSEQADLSSREFHTDPGKMMGTPRYMSPEQVRGKHVDARADVFSFGVVLYEMFAGRKPFDGESPGDVIAAILDYEPLSLERCGRKVPVELARIVQSMLAKAPAQRYQTIKELHIALKNLKSGLELGGKLKQKRSAFVSDEAEGRQSPDTDAGSTLSLPPLAQAGAAHVELEPVGGAMSLDSKFYIVRPTDDEFHAAIARQDSVVLVKGARQVGKTSLLARGLQQARVAGAKVVRTDLQKLNANDLASVEAFYLALEGMIADQLDLDVAPEEVWNARRGASINFERFMRREVLGKLSSPLVWALDEVDRLFTCDFGSEVFGLFRSWHNERSLDPDAPWYRLTMAIAYATEAHLFIKDMNQSPFNVGTRLTLEDFTIEQVAELNRRYGSPLKNRAELERYYDLLNGHPYLAHCGLHDLVTHGRDLAAFEAIADRDDGPFGTHLHRLVASLAQDPKLELEEMVRGILQDKPCMNQEGFYRLRSAGVITGDSVREAKLRCRLYAGYLGKRLL
jgi:serine/threonine protein kinase